jgi:hypothetical protein
VTAGSPAPVDWADSEERYADWGWCHVIGPHYRSDFLDAAYETDVPFVMRYVRGITGVFFQKVQANDQTAAEVRSASATATETTDGVAAEAQPYGVSLTPTQIVAATPAIFRAAHYADGVGVARNALHTSMSVITPEDTPQSVTITPATRRSSLVKAGAGMRS